jgi:hypothetical protein
MRIEKAKQWLCRTILALLLWLLAYTHHAQAAETRLSGPDITSVLQDAELTAEDAGKHVSQIFQKSGVTLYVVDGQQSQGFWRVEGDRYCSQWPPHELWDCYDVGRDGKTIAFISVRGKRYEMQLPDGAK